MRLRIVLVVCAVVALAVGVATATAGNGDSATAGACKDGGWKTLVRADGSSFKNQGDCVSYVAQGGTPSPKTISQLECEALGGTFSTDPTTDQMHVTGTHVVFLWSCNNVPVDPLAALTGLCFADAAAPPNGATYGVGPFAPFPSSCYRID